MMNDKYDYTTPESSIRSLELAFDNEDISQVLLSKDFRTEAILVLKEASIPMSEEIIMETSEALQLSLIKHIQENGFPYFGNIERSFSKLEKIDFSLFKIIERIDNNGHTTENDVYLSFKDNLWKVAMVQER